jgi:hypothetical protein
MTGRIGTEPVWERQERSVPKLAVSLAWAHRLSLDPIFPVETRFVTGKPPFFPQKPNPFSPPFTTKTLTPTPIRRPLEIPPLWQTSPQGLRGTNQRTEIRKVYRQSGTEWNVEMEVNLFRRLVFRSDFERLGKSVREVRTVRPSLMIVVTHKSEYANIAVVDQGMRESERGNSWEKELLE